MTQHHALRSAGHALQVIAIVTGGGAGGQGLFFPDGLNGAINGSSVVAVSTDAATSGRRKLKVSLHSAGCPENLKRRLVLAHGGTACPQADPGAETDAPCPHV